MATTTKPLTVKQKYKLMDRAKTIARYCYNEFGDWDVEAAVQGAVDDTADERPIADFFGPRHTAYEFLDENRDEIAWELFETPSPEERKHP